MKYRSTRGGKCNGVSHLSFCDAVLTGLGEDGGLLVPVAIPQVPDAVISYWKVMDYKDLCFSVMRYYINNKEISDKELRGIISEAYSRFRHPEVTPLEEMGDFFVLDLFHGPSYSFKDVALQFLGVLFDFVLTKRNSRLVVLGATSGDTGSAAICGLRGRQNLDCVILYPKGKTSRIQELQMTTVIDPNIYCVAVDGTFDDCQNLVKECFSSPLKERLHLGAVNSINWGRILAQMVYYWYACFRVLEKKPEVKAVDFCVPTGNFGNILAGYYAKKMGAPIGNLIIATNTNNILVRCRQNGKYELEKVTHTMSPAMDIQVSSNFERFLHNAAQGNSKTVRLKFEDLRKRGAFELGEDLALSMRDSFFAYSANEVETADAIKCIFAKCARLADPHTAVGYSCMKKYMARLETDAFSDTSSKAPANAMVLCSTAHFGKFYKTMAEVLGERALIDDMPQELTFLDQLSSRNDNISNSLDDLSKYLTRRFDPNFLDKSIDWFINNPLPGVIGTAAVLGAIVVIFSTRNWA